MRTFLPFCWLAAAGCSESIEPPATPDAPPAATRVATTRVADGTYTTRVDSTAQSEWVHGDFETGGELAAGEAWDLRFQRFHISTNGGSSGSGGVEVAMIADRAFADVTAPPADGWRSDAADDADEDSDPEYAFEQGDGWYDYDPMTHVLTPKPLVWVVRTNGGATVKLEIIDYYDDAGTAGWFTLHWSPM